MIACTIIGVVLVIGGAAFLAIARWLDRNEGSL